jgi:hypothetical protein
MTAQGNTLPCTRAFCEITTAAVAAQEHTFLPPEHSVDHDSSLHWHGSAGITPPFLHQSILWITTAAAAAAGDSHPFFHQSILWIMTAACLHDSAGIAHLSLHQSIL